MKARGVAFPIFVLGSILGSLGAAPSSRAQEDSYSYSASKRNEDAVLKYLLPALSSAGKRGRLYYRAACHAEGDPVPFPLIEARPPSKDEKGLTAVQQIFRNDKDVAVTEKPSGIITIRIGEISAAILQTKIPLLRLDPDEQYNPTEAIDAIESSKDMDAAMRNLGVSPVSIPLGGLSTPPGKGLPHLPPSMKNVTVHQALDSIARTFQGIVIYGECAEPAKPGGPRLFWLDFANVTGFNDSQ